MKRKLIISIIMSLLLVLTIGISAYAEGNDLDNSSQQQTGDTTPQVTSGGNENQTVSDNVNETVNDNANQADANNQNNDNNQGNNLGDNNQGNSNLDDNNQGDSNNQDDNSNLNQGDSNNQVDNNQGNSVEDNPNDTSTNNSGYTVDLSYQEKTASITGGTTENLLSDVLKNIGIEDEIIDAKAYQDVACTILAEDGIVKDGDKELFKIYQKDSLWYIDSINSFETEHGLWIKTIQSQNISQYKIKVTDPTSNPYKYLNPVYNTTDTPTSGIDRWEEKTYNISSLNVISSSNKLTAWGAAGTETWYAVNGTITIDQTITVTGDVHLVLLNGCNLTVNGNSGAGIRVTGSNKLTIYAQSTGNDMGRLTVTGGSNGAGIGGGQDESGENITINGGVVTATGGSNGAGIGGGGGDNGGNGEYITINGGTVTATGGNKGAGIGSGYSDEYVIAGKNITINGGAVTATGGQGGAGIGGGKNENGEYITINGGTVTATGKDGGAGIGGGYGGAGSNITINGGIVTATGENYGIGCGTSATSQEKIYASASLTVTAGASAENNKKIENVNDNDELIDLATIEEFKKPYVKIELGLISLTASGTVVVAEKSYDGNTTAEVTTNGTLARQDGENLEDKVTFSVSATYDTEGVGNSKTITVTYTLTSHTDKYQAPASYTYTESGKITQKEVTLNWTAPANLVYDGSAKTPTVVVSNLVDGDSCDVTAALSSGKDNVNVGKFTFTASDLSNKNYKLPTNVESNEYEITAKEVSLIWTAPANLVYDGSAKTPTVVVSNLVDGDSCDVTAALSSGKDNVNVGKFTFTASGLSNTNYKLPTNVESNEYEITPLKLTASDPTITVEKTYDSNTKATVTVANITNKISKDSVALIATAAYDTKDVGIDKTITVTYSISGTDAKNYTAPDKYEINTGKINAIQLTVSGTTVALTREYNGGTSSEVTYNGTLTGVVSGETVTLKATATYKSKNAAENIAIKVVYTLEGNDAKNYLAPVDKTDLTASITKKQLEVSGTVINNKTYDGNTDATVGSGNKGTLSGIVSTENVEISTVTATFADKNAGNNKQVTAVYTIVGTDSGNYLAPKNNTSLKANISPLSTSVTGTTVADKIYDGTTNATVNPGNLVGVIAGDEVSVSATGTFNTKDAGTDKAVTVQYALTGGDSSNYSLQTTTESKSAAINKRSVNLKSASDSKEYDGNPLTNYIVVVSGDGFASKEGATYTFTGTQTEVGSSVNKFTFNLNGGTNENNYIIKVVEGILTVTEKKAKPASSNGNFSQKVIIVVEPISIDTLPEAVQTVTNEALKFKNLELVAMIQVYELNGNSRIDKGYARFEFDSSILNGKDPSTLRAWKINDDNTMTEVAFEIVDGEIIFNNGELGTYILTA